MIFTQEKINKLKAEDFLKEKISVEYLIKLNLKREEEIKRGFR
jgi:hypothetical protein